jgi:hypothetical protein
MKNKKKFLLFLFLLPLNVFAQYTGGNGRGDNNFIITNRPLFIQWDTMDNNRLVTYDVLAEARNYLYLNASLSLPTGKQTIKKSDSSTYTLSTLQPGLMAGMVSKPSLQQLIRGDFRSILIDPAAGQTATNCNNTTGSFTQLLWLDRDQLVAGITQCYTNKTLTTLYTAGNGSWYNIRNGGAVRINSAGLVTEVFCY